MIQPPQDEVHLFLPDLGIRIYKIVMKTEGVDIQGVGYCLCFSSLIYFLSSEANWTAKSSSPSSPYLGASSMISNRSFLPRLLCRHS